MKAKRKTDDELDVVMLRWPYLPEHVRRTFVEVALQYGPVAAYGEVRFPTPVGAAWSAVEIVLTGPDRVRVRVGEMVRSYTFSGLGLASERNQKRPRAEWRMLRTYAENPEPDAYYKLPYRPNLKVEISRFRKWLQSFFGIPGDPLKPFKSALWLPRFKIGVEE